MPELASAAFTCEEWSFFTFCTGFQNWSTKLSLFFENIKKAHKVSKSCVLLFVFSTKSDKFLHFLLCLHNQVANISFQNRMTTSYLSIPVNQLARTFLHSLDPTYKSRKLAHIPDNIVCSGFESHLFFTEFGENQ